MFEKNRGVQCLLPLRVRKLSLIVAATGAVVFTVAVVLNYITHTDLWAKHLCQCQRLFALFFFSFLYFSACVNCVSGNNYNYLLFYVFQLEKSLAVGLGILYGTSMGFL